MIASLPMYWRPENAAAWMRLWRDVQDAAGVPLPELTPPEALPDDWAEHWLNPNLVASMTCGLPFRTALKGKVTYVATLDFGLPTPHGCYHSHVVTNLPEGPLPRGLRLAYNQADSQSGWATTQSAAPFKAPLDFATKTAVGSHAEAARALLEGRADIAYIDAVTWRLLEQFVPEVKTLRVLGQSVATPGLPVITAKGQDPEPVRRGLIHATSQLSPEDTALLGGLQGVLQLDPAQYYAVPLPTPSEPALQH